MLCRAEVDVVVSLQAWSSHLGDAAQPQSYSHLCSSIHILWPTQPSTQLPEVRDTPRNLFIYLFIYLGGEDLEILPPFPPPEISTSVQSSTDYYMIFHSLSCLKFLAVVFGSLLALSPGFPIFSMHSCIRGAWGRGYIPLHVSCSRYACIWI